MLTVTSYDVINKYMPVCNYLVIKNNCTWKY